jgi:hypothetical protein
MLNATSEQTLIKERAMANVNKPTPKPSTTPRQPASTPGQPARNPNPQSNPQRQTPPGERVPPKTK